MGKKPRKRNGKTREKNWGFNGLLFKKPLNLEKKTRDENCIRIRDERPRLKTSQLRQRHREENEGMKGIKVFLARINL